MALAGEVELLDSGVLGRIAESNALDLECGETDHGELAEGDADADSVPEAGLPDGLAEREADEGDHRREAQRPEGAVVVFGGPVDAEEAEELRAGVRFGGRVCRGGRLARVTGAGRA